MNARRIMIACVVLVASAGQVNGGMVSVSWTGTVTSTPFPGTVDVGDTLTGSWSYDSDTPFSTRNEIQAFYPTNHTSSFSLNSLSGTVTNQMMTIINDHSALSFDQIDTRSSISQVYTGDLFEGLAPRNLFVRFTDSSESVFTNNTSLPSILNPNDFDNLDESFFDFAIPGNILFLRFRVDSFSSSVVPEPTSLAIWTIGLVGMSLASSRRRRRSV